MDWNSGRRLMLPQLPRAVQLQQQQRQRQLLRKQPRRRMKAQHTLSHSRCCHQQEPVECSSQWTRRKRQQNWKDPRQQRWQRRQQLRRSLEVVRIRIRH